MILVLNCGSQSIKWKIFDEKIKLIKQNHREVLDSKDFENILIDELGKITEDISKIGHRVVHGGGVFVKPLKITEENLKELEKISHLAPLHNPYNILGIKICQNIFKNVEQIAVFDTDFFAELPEKSFTYALPESISKEFGFRRYGFQGTSHEYVARKAAEIFKKPFNKLKIITCHLGGGSSITAIKNGKVIDTSMGFTPLEGLVMMTRSGNIDAGIVLELAKKYGAEKTEEILNKESGLKGICGEGDMLSLLKRIEEAESPERSRRVKLALDVFVYSIQKYIGSYFAILDGCDVLVFTGAIGFGSKLIRDMVCKDLNILKGDPSTGSGQAKVLVIETDEELAIATKIKNVIQK